MMKNRRFLNLLMASLVAMGMPFFAACGDDDDDNSSEQPVTPEQKGEETPSGEESTTPNFAPESWYETNYWDRTDREKAGLRGKVKKCHFNSGTHTVYEYDEAGHLTFTRRVDSESTRGEWCRWYTYDKQGRLVKEVYGRVTEKGGNTIDEWSNVETTEYEYDNSEKYVWVDPQSFDSRTFVNYLGTEYREALYDLRKGLTVRKQSTLLRKSGTYLTYYYHFNGNELEVSYESYTTDQNGNPDDDLQTYTFPPITYSGNYPYSGEMNWANIITSMKWRKNGMPLAVDGPSGLTEYSETENRYINPVKWTCKEGNPIDAFFGFVFSREWTYDNKSGEVTLLQEWLNQTSERPWVRPAKWTYTYDSHGNWTSYNEEYMILIDGPDGPVHTRELKRTIEYY
jgi:hypothetical protein